MSKGTGLAERIAAATVVGEKLTKREMLERVGANGTGVSPGVRSAVLSLLRQKLFVESGFKIKNKNRIQTYERVAYEQGVAEVDLCPVVMTM